MLFREKLILILWLATRTSGSTQWESLSNFQFSLDALGYEIPAELALQKEHIKIYNHSLVTKNGIRKSTNYSPIFLDWTKILPEVCTSKVNHTQINYYKEIIDLLLHRDIEPVVTLYSGNLPQKLAPLGGWTNPIIVQYFANYARHVFRLFGDRVKTWITFHDPRMICESFDGLIGDEFPSGTAEYLCTHNILKAHAEAYHIYDREFRIVQRGEISIAFDVRWMEPEDISNLNDIRTAEQRMQFEFGLFANPLINVDYPSIVKNRVATRSAIEGFEYSRLPTFTYAEQLRVSGTYDYIRLICKDPVEIAATRIKDDGATKSHFERDSGGKLIISDAPNKENEKKWPLEYGCQKLSQWIIRTYNG